MNLTRFFKRTPAGVPSAGEFAHDTKKNANVTLPSTPVDPDKLNYGDQTPYGPADPYRTDVDAEGVQHFGSQLYAGRHVLLSEERNAAIPEEYRKENRFYDDDGQGVTGMDIVMVTHPDAFSEEDLEQAKDRIAIRDAPQDLQKDLRAIRTRASISRDQEDRLREQIEAHRGAEREWAASTVAAGVLEQFPRAKEISYLLHGDNLVGSISVSDGEKPLGGLSMKQDGTIIGNGPEGGQEYLHSAVRQLEDISDTQMQEQGAEVSSMDSNGERTVTLRLNPVLDQAAERIRNAEAHRR